MVNLFDLLEIHGQRGAGGYGGTPVAALPPPPPPELSTGAPPYIPQTPSSFFEPSFQGRPNQGANLGMMAVGNPLGMLGAGIGSLISKGIQKFKGRKPEAKVGNALDRAIDSALEQKTARILSENPNVSPRDAIIASARELFASTSTSQQSPAFKDRIRVVAMGKLAQMGEFDPEAQAKFASAKKDLAVANEPADLGTLKSFRGKDGRTITMPEKLAASFLAKNPGAYELVDTPAQPSPGDTITSFVGDQRLTRTYDPSGSITGLTPNEAGYVIERGDARAAAGGPESDQRTPSQTGLAQADIQNNFVGLEVANQQMDNIIALSLEAEKTGIAGVTGTVGSAYRILGEAGSVIKAAAEVSSSMFGTNARVYDGGKMTFSELTDSKKYEKEFGSFFKGAELSQRARASLINLAYLLAISQEASARAISDKDIAFRLQTIGAGVSRGETLRQILEDRRKEMFGHLEAKLKYDPYFGNIENQEAQFFAGKLDEARSKWLNKTARPDEAAPVISEPQIIIGPGGIPIRVD